MDGDRKDRDVEYYLSERVSRMSFSATVFQNFLKAVGIASDNKRISFS